MMQSGKHITSLLLIAYKFPPMQSVSCNRTWALYQEMHRFFDEVFVISTSNRHKPPQDEIDTSAVRITDIKTVDYRTLFQSDDTTAVASEKMKQSMAGRTAMKLQSSFPFLYLFGEGNAYYIRKGVKAAERILRQHKVSHVFSSFPPYADHLIAAALKQSHPDLVWIADFRDLHVDPAQDNLFGRARQKKVNKRILRHADVVATVSEGLAEHLRELHSNVVVLPNGIRTNADNTSTQYPRFTISYTGSMFQDKRKPDALLMALKQLIAEGKIREEEIQLLYAGKDSPVWQSLIEQFGLSSIFADRGLVSRTEAEFIQRSSHINLLLTYSTEALKGNLTGKLFDYLSARRPLLVIVNGPADAEIESLIMQTQAGEVVYHGNVEHVKKFIMEKMREWRETRTVIQDYNENALQRMQWPSRVDNFMQRLNLHERAEVIMQNAQQ